jgi:hypothetical protein
MNGQWIGRYTGTNSGEIILNADDRGSCFRGVAYLNDSEPNLPWIGAGLWTRNKDSDFAFSTDDLWPIHPKTRNAAIWDDVPDAPGGAVVGVKQLFPAGVGMPRHADVTGRWDGHSLKLTWKTDIGTSGSCELPRSRADQPSDLKPLQMGWADFKEYVSKLAGNQHLFRGQKEPWRLRTTFHRTGRADLIRFVGEDIQRLHRHLRDSARIISHWKEQWCSSSLAGFCGGLFEVPVTFGRRV